MDIHKTKKGIDASQKKFVSRAFDLIRDCSDNYHTPASRERDRPKPIVGAVLSPPGISIPMGTICSPEFVSGKKILEVDAMTQTLLNKYIRLQEVCSKSLR